MSKAKAPPKKNSPAKSSGRLDRPFAPGIMAEARLIAADYQIVLSEEDGHWYGRGLEMPHVFGDGPTATACIKSTQEALVVAAAYLLEKGTRPPAAARFGKRTLQVNIRLTAEEKAVLEGTAQRKGFEGLSDFIRAAALESVR